ncbi:sulfite exporter TauE/SafE family protein [Pseudomonas tohonis]|uniref:sulfite exporter TauE/SafE family protein n=1 Tax=Pseudomonas tohonis TaxID=2725477 RepID=UPI001F2A45A1|nr:sulfite exporter TauE/SafE family protein [Pseudomonas tohonis]
MSVESLFALLSFSPTDWLLIAGAIALAYVVFGIAGFGTALVAGPLLVSSLPMARIIPLLVLLDFVASAGSWFTARQAVAGSELRRLLPCMALGCAVGAYGLVNLDAELLMLLFGLFVCAYAIWSLFLQPVRQAPMKPLWGVPFGVFGGTLGALFGSGGFLYALYLSGRLPEKEQIRATQSALIGCSTLVRLGLFVLAGLYADWQILLLALSLLPAMALGLWTGRRLTLRLSREAFVRLVTWLVLCSGVALVARYLALQP